MQLSALVTHFKRKTFLSVVDQTSLSVAEYCQLRQQQWEQQAKKSYGPVKGAAVVADDVGWEQWEKFGLDASLDSFFVSVLKSKGRLLDFGCGVGRVLRSMQARGYHVDGVDLAPSVLEGAVEYCGSDAVRIVDEENVSEAYSKGSGMLFICNGFDLPTVPNAAYDGVFSVVCLIHILHPQVRNSLYQSFYRILRPGGACCLMFFMSDNDSFGSYREVRLDRGAFAFRTLEEIQFEFSTLPWTIQDIELRAPIEADRAGGVDKTVFIKLIKPLL